MLGMYDKWLETALGEITPVMVGIGTFCGCRDVTGVSWE
jgi:hypothetical protein